MTVCYLEIDDEITTAIARLRAVTDGEAVIVVPPGSRIATSRINFKLLAREATERRLTVAAVSDDPAVRALAISAGLPTYDTLTAAESALATFREQDRQLEERLRGGAAARRSAPSEDRARPSAVGMAPPVEPRTPIVAKPAASLLETQETQVMPVVSDEGRAKSVRRERARRVPVAPLLVVGLVALLLAAVAYGAYAFLPTATITLTPQTTTLSVGTFTVIADPGVAVVDSAAGTLPAQPIELPLHVDGTFAATGVEVRESRATGVVRFRSENTVEAVDVAQGTVVATGNGIQFETTERATVPRADFSTSTPGTVEVPVRAVRLGTRGNVAAGAITELPASLAQHLVSVRNPNPTDGGRHTEENVVTEADYAAAVTALSAQLDVALAAALADPASIPGGLTAYSDTASHDEGVADQPADVLVGTVTPTFALALDATGSVLAVNETLIDEMARDRLDAALGPGQQLVGDEPTVNHGPGVVADEFISYSVSASVAAYSSPDVPTLVGQVRGKTVAEARAILAAYGMVQIAMWPDFIDRLPDQPSRISLTITPPSAGS